MMRNEKDMEKMMMMMNVCVGPSRTRSRRRGGDHIGWAWILCGAFWQSWWALTLLFVVVLYGDSAVHMMLLRCERRLLMPGCFSPAGTMLIAVARLRRLQTTLGTVLGLWVRLVEELATLRRDSEN